MLLYIFYLPDIYHCLINVYVNGLYLYWSSCSLSTRDLNKFMSDFDVLKFIVNVMEHV